MDFGIYFRMDPISVEPPPIMPAMRPSLVLMCTWLAGSGKMSVEALLQVYQKHGVSTDLVQVLKDYPTGVVNVELTESGLPTFTIGENAAWDHWEWNQEIEGTVEAKSRCTVFWYPWSKRGIQSEGYSRPCHGPRSEHSPYSGYQSPGTFL